MPSGAISPGVGSSVVFIPGRVGSDSASGSWILATGNWNDSGVWDDSAVWID